jgi:hypothetical protein
MGKRYSGKENREREKKQKFSAYLRMNSLKVVKNSPNGKILKTKEKTAYICAWICRTKRGELFRMEESWSG